MSIPSVARSESDLEASENRLIRQINAAENQGAVETILAEINELVRRSSSSLEQKQSLKRCRQRAYDRRRKLQNEEEYPMASGNNLVEFPPIGELQRSQQFLVDEVRDLKDLLEKFNKSQNSETKNTQALDSLSIRLGQMESDNKNILRYLITLDKSHTGFHKDLQSVFSQVSGVSDKFDERLEKFSSEFALLQEEIESAHKPHPSTARSQDFLTGAFRQFGKLDGEVFARYFPLALTLFLIVGAIAWFVADQITPLYQAFKFDRPELVAWGSIGMAVGFSGIYGALRSRPAGFMCGLILVYEVLFVIAGTKSHEQIQQTVEAEAVPAITFAMAEMKKAKSDYDRNQARYEDEKDKMYQNAWFNSTYIEPAWDKYSEKQSGYTGLRTQYLEENGGFGLQGFLKLFYRVCAVILLMIVTGLAIRKIRDSIAFQS